MNGMNRSDLETDVPTISNWTSSFMAFDPKMPKKWTSTENQPLRALSRSQPALVESQ